MLTFTDRAREAVRSYLDAAVDEFQALRISAEPGSSPVAPQWALTLVGGDEREADDVEVATDDFLVLVEKEMAPQLEGATVDFVERVNASGFEVRTRQEEMASVGAGAGGGNGSAAAPTREPPTGEFAERIQTLLDERINPAIASHGGQITLVDVDGTEIYMEMSGGCQGCAMSRITLQQGVERMLRQEIPEISAIHDVTDHTAGDNPYY